MPQVPFGERALDLVSDPVEQPDGSWLKLQNAEYSSVAAQGGLKKRGGLSALNTEALGGEVFNAIAVPLRSLLDESTPGYLISTSTGFLWTTDGVTFTPIAAAPALLPTDTFPWATRLMRTIDIDGATHLFYVGDNGGDPWLYDFDGNTATPVLDLSGTTPMDMTTLNDKVYLAVNNNTVPTLEYSFGSPLSGRIIEWDPNLGSSQTIGEEFGVSPKLDQNTLGPMVGFYAGYGWTPVGISTDGTNLYVSVGGYITTDTDTTKLAVMGIIVRLNPDTETAWTYTSPIGATAEHPLGPGGLISPAFFDPGEFGIASMTAIGGFTGPNTFGLIGSSDHPTLATIGLSETFDPGVSPPAGGRGWWSDAIFIDGLTLMALATSASGTGAAVFGKIYATADILDNLAVELDVLGTYGGNVFPGTPYSDGTDLFWPWYGGPGTTNAGFILKRTSSTNVWTQAETGIDLTGAAIPGPVPVA